MLPQAKNYTCLDCGKAGQFTGYRQARKAAWAVSADYSKCYCPDCAPAHRRGKATEKNDEPAPLPNGWEQVRIENI